MKTKIWLALIALYIVWGSTYLAIRFVVETIPPFMSAGLRFLIAGAILFAWRRMAGDAAPTKKQWISTAIVGVALLLCSNGVLSWAEQRVPSGIASLIISTIPLWLVLFEAFRPGGIKPSWRAIIGLLIGFGGVFLLIGPAEFSGKSTTQFDTFGTDRFAFCRAHVVARLDLQQTCRHAKIFVDGHRRGNVGRRGGVIDCQRGERRV